MAPLDGTGTPAPDWSVVVLTGGAGSRLGRDKATVQLNGVSLLDRILTAIPGHIDVVVVGAQPEAPARPVRVTREEPPGGGPVAGISAGLVLVATPMVAVCAVDMPFAAGALAAMVDLLRADEEAAAVLPRDERDVPQPLCAVYRSRDLRRAIAAGGTAHGRSVRSVLARLNALRHIPAPAGHDLSDIDTPADLEAARTRASQRLRGPGGGIVEPGDSDREGHMKEWVDRATAELGIAGGVDVDLVLDVAKDVAHGVERPAAPVSTYLLGLAVGAGADPVTAAATLRELARTWNAES